MIDVTQAFAEAFAEAAIPKFRQVVKEEIQASKLEDLKEKIVDTDEVMEMFHCSRGTVYNWEREGKIKSYLLGGRRLFKYSELLESLEKIKKYSR